MAGPNKTKRVVAADAPRYRIKDGAPKHYIGGRIVGAGDVVTLTEGVKPGAWLELMAAPKADKPEKSNTKAE